MGKPRFIEAVTFWANRSHFHKLSYSAMRDQYIHYIKNYNNEIAFHIESHKVGKLSYQTQLTDHSIMHRGGNVCSYL